MSDIINDQIKTFEEYEKSLEVSEKAIVNNYGTSQILLKQSLAKAFEQFESDGKLNYEDMVAYNRLTKLQKELTGITVRLYQDNSNIINDTLETTYKDAFNKTTQAVSRAWGKDSLLGIIRDDEIQKAVNNDISGLRWAERMERHKDKAAAYIRETIVQGLHNGESYRQMANRLNEVVGKDVKRAITIVRAESGRVFSEAQKDRFDRIAKNINLIKKWITSKDEKVRDNHVSMHGVSVAYKQNFKLANGNEGFAPRQIGDPKDDIGCRCFYVVDKVDDRVDDSTEDGIIDDMREDINALPRYKEAIIPEAKILKYALENDTNKAEAFKEALGYTKDNAYRLIENIRYNLPYYPAVQKEDTGYGTRYAVTMYLTGPNGKEAKVLTAWIDDKNNGEMRLTSAYVDN